MDWTTCDYAPCGIAYSAVEAACPRCGTARPDVADPMEALRGTVAGRLDGVRIGSVDARAQVARQPHHLGRALVSDADGWAALHALTAAAFGDHDDWRASIPASDSDTDLVVHRWVRDLVRLADVGRAVVAHIASPGAEDAAVRHATVPETLDHLDDLEAERDKLRAERTALAAELAAMRGEAAPKGWEWGAGRWALPHPHGAAMPLAEVYRDGSWRCGWGSARREGTCDRMTGPDGAFAAAEAAAGIR